jgi:excisionase family DNA binding protein
MRQRYLTARQAAVYLGFGEDDKGVDVIYQWVHRGKIPHSKIGPGTLRFDIQALDAWMVERAKEPKADRRSTR